MLVGHEEVVAAAEAEAILTVIIPAATGIIVEAVAQAVTGTICPTKAAVVDIIKGADLVHGLVARGAIRVTKAVDGVEIKVAADITPAVETQATAAVVGEEETITLAVIINKGTEVEPCETVTNNNDQHLTILEEATAAVIITKTVATWVTTWEEDDFNM